MIIDNVHAPLAGDQWTPRLEGDVFCSPACGFSCKKEAFDQATLRATEIAMQLGDGWYPRVWENCGWNFEVKKGSATVSHDSDRGYTATIEFSFTDNSVEKMSKTSGHPRQAMADAIEAVNQKIAMLRRVVLSVSLEDLKLGGD